MYLGESGGMIVISGFTYGFFALLIVIAPILEIKKAMFKKEHRSKHEMRPKLGRISWTIYSFVGIIHPVGKVGVTDHPGAT